MTLRKAAELQHNSRDEVADWIEQARDLVAAAELDDDLRPIAFAKALDLLAAKQIQYESMQANGLGLIPRAG